MKVRLDSPQVPQVFLRISSGSSGVTASSRLAPSLCVIHHFKHPQRMLIYVCHFLKDLLRFLRFSSGFSRSPQDFLRIFSGSSGFLMNLLRLHRFSSGSPQVLLWFSSGFSGSPHILLRFLSGSSGSPQILDVSWCLSASVHSLWCVCPAAAQRASVERVEPQSTQEGGAAEENNEITEGRRLRGGSREELGLAEILYPSGTLGVLVVTPQVCLQCFIGLKKGGMVSVKVRWRHF